MTPSLPRIDSRSLTRDDFFGMRLLSYTLVKVEKYNRHLADAIGKERQLSFRSFTSHIMAPQLQMIRSFSRIQE